MKIGRNKTNLFYRAIFFKPDNLLRLESAAAYQAVVGFFWSLGFQSACFPLSTTMKQKITHFPFDFPFFLVLNVPNYTHRQIVIFHLGLPSTNW